MSVNVDTMLLSIFKQITFVVIISGENADLHLGLVGKGTPPCIDISQGPGRDLNCPDGRNEMCELRQGIYPCSVAQDCNVNYSRV